MDAPLPKTLVVTLECPSCKHRINKDLGSTPTLDRRIYVPLRCGACGYEFNACMTLDSKLVQLRPHP